MKFEISRTSGTEFSLIEINSLEELLELVEVEDEAIIISKCYFCCRDEASYSIEIYDDYRE